MAEAFNAYWTSQGAPTSGTLDVPVNVSLSTGGQVLLTNLVMTPTPSDGKLTASDITFGASSPTEGQNVLVRAMVNNPTESKIGPLTVGFYAAVPGWGDWHIGSAFISSIPANGATQTSIQWNTEGFTGTVPVRAVIDPFNHVVERDETNNEATKEITILTRPDLKVISIEPEEAARQGLFGNLLVTVQNGGDSDAGSQSVSLYNGDPDDGGTLIGTQTVAVSAHNSQVISIPWTPSTLGPLTFYAKADSQNVISEFNEANNLGSQTIYVGWGDPVYIDAGSPNEQAYDSSVGYGYLTDGTTVNSCGNDPEQTYHEMGSTQALEYQFDHLLPDRFYHLDLTFFLCNGSREQRILVDGVEVLDSVTANNQPNTISLLLDPTLYADNQIVVAIEKIGSALGGAVVSELKLTDIRYCYRDSGHPTEASYATATDGCGWLNGTADQNWGTRTHESVRYVNGGNLQYRFDGLESGQAYQMNLTFYENDNAGRMQSVLIDGVTVLSNISLSSSAQKLTVDVPATYADGTIEVEIAGSSQVIISEIALEQKTIRNSGPTPTPSPTPTVPTNTPTASATVPTSTPTASATVPTSTPTASATVPTSTPTASATVPTSTPTVTGTSSASTPIATGTSSTSTPIATNTATNTPIPDPSSPIVRTGTYHVVPGNTFTMMVEALNVPAPGLGAANISVFYDPTLIQPTQNACSFESPLSGNCNTTVSVGQPNGSKQCPPPPGALYTPHCDVNTDAACNVIDGMFVLQCNIGIPNVLCPAPLSHTGSSRNNQQTEGGADATVTIGTHQIEPLTTVTVPVHSTLPDGVLLGAANLRMTYDTNVVKVSSCTINSDIFGVCNTDTSGVIEFNIVSTSGISGSFALAEITFQAIGQAGNSTPLDMEVEIFADTSGNAIPVNITDGELAIGSSSQNLLYLPLLLK